MNLNKSLMGRRQFLVAAGVSSTAALAGKRLADVMDPVFQTGVARASDGRITGDTIGDFSNRYSHLLSPIKIGNVALKNRMISPNALPHYLQGPEVFPADAMISHYANVARNGAAVVTFRGCGLGSTRKMFDIDNSGVQNYLAQMADAIHFYGSKANVALTIDAEPAGYDISERGQPDMSEPMRGEKYRMTGAAKEIPIDEIEKMIEDITKLAKTYQSLGFDMVNLYMSYRSSILANSMSPEMNFRTDKYGGSLENRARLSIELCQSIKKACGQDFLIEAQVSGEEEEGGYTLEDLTKFAKLWEGSIDILQLRAWDGSSSHPTGYDSEKGKPVTLRYAEAIKKSGAKIVTAPVGGYQDLDLNEEYIASGKTDMIAMGRAFICDPEYGQKAYEGRGEDVVPCIRCNKCHGNIHSSNLDVCSVNPKLGFAHKIDRMIAAPLTSRRVAVIGGGPAGMKAALVAAERGHKVTLYEKNDYLGGQLRHTDFASFQWPIRDFKDYLIYQIKKAGVEVRLNTNATPEMLKSGGYDAIIAAIGAGPVVPNIPGADGVNIYNVVDVFGKEKDLGKNVVVIGADLIGTQTGMYLAENNHKVTVLTSNRELMANEGPHQSVYTYWDMPDFSFMTEATAKRISGGKVTYTDAKGNEKTISADSVVVYAGFKPRMDEALKFSGSADRFFTIGNCHAVGFVRECNRTAFAAASQI